MTTTSASSTKIGGYVYPDGTDATQPISIPADTLDRLADAFGYKKDISDIELAADKVLTGVEILRPGVWNNTKITKADLKSVVDSFGKVGWRVPIKLGHTMMPGSPAYGWVSSVYVEGDVLKADFENLPDEVYTQIKEKRYNHVSVELFFNMKDANQKKKYGRVLKAVALLGAETPAVQGLQPLENLQLNLKYDDVKLLTDFKEFSNMTFDSAKYADMNGPAKVDAIRKDFAKAVADGADDDVVKAFNDALTQAIASVMEAASNAVAESKRETAELSKKLEGEGKDAVAFAELSEKFKELSKRLEQSEAEKRSAAIDSKVGKLTVPSLRALTASLYEGAYKLDDQDELVTFTHKGDDGEVVTSKMSAVSIVDTLVDRLNEQAKTLFTQTTQETDIKRQYLGMGDAEEELEAKIRSYRLKNPDASYTQAMNDVLAADPNLAREYAALVN